MSYNFEKWTILVARVFLSAIFLKAAIDRILTPEKSIQTMGSMGVPGWLLIPTIIVLLVGGISVLVGYKARYGALLLIGFLIPTTLVFHTNFAERSQEVAFLKNLGLIGGLLMLAVFGPGSLSFDNRILSTAPTELKE